MNHKKILLNIFVLLVSSQLFAQVKFGFNFSMMVDTTKTRVYDITKLDLPDETESLIIPVKFNDEEIISRAVIDGLNDGLTQIVAIDYVYTQYKDRKTQDLLNKRRIFELYINAPFIFTQTMTKWTFVEQLGFAKDEDAKNLFHGFVIKYKKIKPYEPVSVSQIKLDIMDGMKNTKDNVVVNIYNRNPVLKRELIVTDVTGSMSPYFMDLFTWYCLQKFDTASAFALFNDGDTKSDDQKVIGSTGGIHQFKTNNIDTISKYLYESIIAGSGGDCPENDIEAILKALAKNPKAKEVILIADNWSDMRDYALRSRITVPVHIFLCNTSFGINPQYLNLAMETKGSIHTLKEDINDLYDKQDGSTFILNGITYLVRNHRIEKLSKT